MAAIRNTIGPQPGAQQRFLSSPADVAVYGGAAGGGKTFALLLEAMRHVNNPRYGALLFRRSYPQIMTEGGLWDEATALYTQLDAHPNLGGPEFRFSTGASVGFAHLQHEKTKYEYQGAQIPMLGFDEGTHYSWGQFSYLLGRNRSTCGIKPYTRITCNPDPDHWLREFLDWWIGEDGFPIPERSGVLRWFAVQRNELFWADSPETLVNRLGPECMPLSATFVPASLDDNPALLEHDPNYRAKLRAGTEAERQRLELGNWDAREAAGDILPRSRVGIAEAAPADVRWVRAWDLAGTAGGGDWTVGLLMGMDSEGYTWIGDVVRGQWADHEVRSTLYNTATQDGREVPVRLPQDPGQAGKSQVSDLTRLLNGFTVRSQQPTGSKFNRARPFAAQVQAGNVRLVRGPWNNALLREWDNWTGKDGEVDDQIDAAADAYDELTNHVPRKPRIRVA